MGLFSIFTREKELDTGERVKVLDPAKYIGFGTLAGVIAVVVWIVASTHTTLRDVAISFLVGVGLFGMWGWISWIANRKPLDPEPELYPWETTAEGPYDEFDPLH